jgi:flagellar basal-body rod protein FlgG
MILEMTRPAQGGLRQERKLEASANNLANVDTTGFKKDVISFDRMFKAQFNTDFSQGSIRSTGSPLDLAIAGRGFFKVQTSSGVNYTRNGVFSLNADKILVDQNGDPVLGKNGSITIDGEQVDINEAGEVYVDGNIIDSLDVVDFDNLRKLEKKGLNNFVYKGNPSDEKLPEHFSIKQSAIEGSNVKTVDEMVNMIDHNRMYEVFQKMMLTFDEIDGKAINDLGILR